MSPNIDDELQINSYEFLDSNDSVVINFYAHGAFEQRDIEVLIDPDLLEISTPADEKWKFQLYAHVYAATPEMKAQINENRTQTTIELRLFKQTPITWPQLYSLQSTPITPQRNDLNKDMNDQEKHSSIEQQEPYVLSIKKLKTEFLELTHNTAISNICIKEVYNCQVQFNETNFTAIFCTNDEQFLQCHSIPLKMPIKLFVRVKQRIKPAQCSYSVTSTHITINLIKENENGIRWYQLEPNEYCEPGSMIQSSSVPPHRLSAMNPMSTINNTNPDYSSVSLLSNNRMSDKYSTRSSFNVKDITHMPSISSPSSIGYTGIYNPANSCFMNAAIQCLSNTRELRDYFLQSYYTIELNRVNPLGMKGAMAEEFGRIIKELWAGKYNYIIANQIRDYAAKRHQEFVGNGQHDAQELLTILLDAIHEDLNRVLNKPLVPPIEADNRSDDIIADEYWRGYLSRNNSIIVQLFTGQFKSKTKCPQCHKESVTFDPFTSVSVPLPKHICVDTIITFRNEDKPPIKYRFVMSSDASIAELKRRLSNKCDLQVDKMLAYKIQNNRSIEYLKDEDRVTGSTYSWSNSDTTYITETLTSAECNNEKIIHLTFFQRIFKLHDYILSCGYCQALPQPNSSPLFCKNCYRISYCDGKCQKLHATEHKGSCESRSEDNYGNIGLPFIISLPESKLTCENVFQQINIYAKRSVDIHIDPSKRTRRSFDDFNRDYSDVDDDDEEDSFSDIEEMDPAIIKSTLSSSDSWSIVRIGDYFVKSNKNKRRSNQQNDSKEKILKSTSTNNNDDEQESMITNGESVSSKSSSMEDFDMLDDIYGNQRLFRIMPQTTNTENNNNNNFQSIIECGTDSDNILRCHTTFSIDWFTDNTFEASLHVTPSRNRNGLNDLIEDNSVSNSFAEDQDVTLQQCLQLFIEPEVLGPDDKWYCPNCKEHIQAEKKISIWRLPPILIIHLKRFKYSHSSSFGYMSSSREKIDTTIKFPIHDLNMTPYCSSITEENQQDDNSFQSRYDLYGIINHRGSAWFGHYTSYARLLALNDSAKTEIGWRHFDDQFVSSLPNVKDLVRSDAYVLFYRHRNLSVNFALQEQLQHTLLESKLTTM
ncbi:unnamed protein product [Rotaria sordida]|uniref:ubiquitinyl hydrolase 1 n=1 Tax=Rotaria sordida TaxID=392033 RepID=A0A818SMY9_9BILA|nr:unnamed protein product [Rotaria sordida]CAF3671466.1 unnamed protein product [Rotaria sordida]